MWIARLDTPEGPRYAVWTGHAWEVVADCFSDPPVSTGVSIAGSPNRLVSVTPGDIVKIRLAGVGSLTNRVI
jgi:hypothetical protein